MLNDGAKTSKGLAPEVLKEALESANVPTLLLVLTQMTGDARWLAPPYQLSRNRGLDDNDSGGLSAKLQEEVRAAAFEAILAWQNGRALALAAPDTTKVVSMLSAAMAEPIPDEYGPMILDELLATGRPVPDDAAPLPEGFKYIIIGAGVSGLCAAIQLRHRGAEVEMLEQNSSVGGTWLQNRYPGAGVDTPNHLYSFSFAARDWPHYFSAQPEIQDYLKSVAEQFGVYDQIRFDTKVLKAEYMPSRQGWEVTIQSNGGEETLWANVVISAVGAFALPRFPAIDGLDTFGGELVHAAQWDDGFDLAGKKVAVIGNGASAMQIVPAIADEAGSLTIFQRSPQWIVPFEKCRKPVPEPVRNLIEAVPLYRKWYRLRLGWTFNDRLFDSLKKDPFWPTPEVSLNKQNDAYRRMFTQYLEEELDGRPDLIAKSTPGYPPYGKRILLDNGWYRALRKEHTTLCVDAIQQIDATGIVTADGTHHEVDAIIFATGFQVSRYLSSFDVVGREGVNIRDAWDDDDCQAYMGTVIPRFPNFFMLYGPNTQPGHGGSFIFICEAQVHYVLSILEQMATAGLASVECKQNVCDVFNDEMMARHEQMIWTHEGMSTYYRNTRGRVVVTIPYRNVDFWHMTRKADLDDFIVKSTRHGKVAQAAM